MASPLAIRPMADVIDKIHDSRYDNDNVFKTKPVEDDFAAEPLVNHRQNEQRFGDKILNLSRTASLSTNTPSSSIILVKYNETMAKAAASSNVPHPSSDTREAGNTQSSDSPEGIAGGEAINPSGANPSPQSTSTRQEEEDWETFPPPERNLQLSPSIVALKASDRENSQRESPLSGETQSPRIKCDLGLAISIPPFSPTSIITEEEADLCLLQPIYSMASQRTAC